MGVMNYSVLFQILGSLAVLVGYYFNSKGNVYQHFCFILGHIFLLMFTALEEKWVLFALSITIIILQYRISKRKWKFKKNLVRVKRLAKRNYCIIKPYRFERSL
jgi:hypothetical protein